MKAAKIPTIDKVQKCIVGICQLVLENRLTRFLCLLKSVLSEAAQLPEESKTSVHLLSYFYITTAPWRGVMKFFSTQTL